jgi:hypothetical protein
VVVLVLNDPCSEVERAKVKPFALPVKCADGDFACTRHNSTNLGDAEAPLPILHGVGSNWRDVRIHQHDWFGGMLVICTVDCDKEPKVDVDLRRGEPSTVILQSTWKR